MVLEPLLAFFPFKDRQYHTRVPGSHSASFDTLALAARAICCEDTTLNHSSLAASFRAIFAANSVDWSFCSSNRAILGWSARGYAGNIGGALPRSSCMGCEAIHGVVAPVHMRRKCHQLFDILRYTS